MFTTCLFFVLAVSKPSLFLVSISSHCPPSPRLYAAGCNARFTFPVSVKVNGERNPTEVYSDFRSAVLQILSAHRTPVPAIVPNGNYTAPVQHSAGLGGGVRRPDDDDDGGGGVRRPDDNDDGGAGPRPTDRDAVPLPAGRDAERDAQRRPAAKTAGEKPQPTKCPTVVCVVGEYGKNKILARESRKKKKNQLKIFGFAVDALRPSGNTSRFLTVTGGPGSNKSVLCQKVLRANPSWALVSVGPILRSLASSQAVLQEKISSGQIVDEVSGRLNHPYGPVLYRSDFDFDFFFLFFRLPSDSRYFTKY